MESQQTLIDALIKAQSQMGHAVFDQTNPHFKSKFASLKSVIDAVKPALNANGIAFVQKSIPMEHGIAVETVFHGHGDTLPTGPVPVPIDRENAQGFGSALTYAKRYSLAMACGISADEDDDGNAAANAAPKRGQAVTKTVIAENRMSVDENKRKQYVEYLIKFHIDEDDAGINQLIEELNEYQDDDAMKTCVWDDLPSRVKTYITKMRGEKK
jgi:hypothetical protein